MNSKLSQLLPVTPNQIGRVTVNAIDGRKLHAFLGVGKVFAAWMPEMIESFDFIEGKDFAVCFPNLESEGRGGQNRKEYLLSIPMAKELCMVSKTAKGKEARLYFIECEAQVQALPSVGGKGPVKLSLTASLVRDLMKMLGIEGARAYLERKDPDFQNLPGVKPSNPQPVIQPTLGLEETTFKLRLEQVN